MPVSILGGGYEEGGGDGLDFVKQFFAVYTPGVQGPLRTYYDDHGPLEFLVLLVHLIVPIFDLAAFYLLFHYSSHGSTEARTWAHTTFNRQVRNPSDPYRQRWLIQSHLNINEPSGVVRHWHFVALVGAAAFGLGTVIMMLTSAVDMGAGKLRHTFFAGIFHLSATTFLIVPGAILMADLVDLYGTFETYARTTNYLYAYGLVVLLVAGVLHFVLTVDSATSGLVKSPEWDIHVVPFEYTGLRGLIIILDVVILALIGNSFCGTIRTNRPRHSQFCFVHGRHRYFLVLSSLSGFTTLLAFLATHYDPSRAESVQYTFYLSAVNLICGVAMVALGAIASERDWLDPPSAAVRTALRTIWTNEDLEVTGRDTSGAEHAIIAMVIAVGVMHLLYLLLPLYKRPLR